MTDDVPWCIICHAPHSPDHYALAQSLVANQKTQDQDEGKETKEDEDIDYNMKNLCVNGEDFDLEDPKNDVVMQGGKKQPGPRAHLAIQINLSELHSGKHNTKYITKESEQEYLY